MRFIWGGFGLLILLAVAVRLPALSQSLWYDEMATLREYVLRPVWHTVAGRYSPNNHILHSLLAQASHSIGRAVGLTPRDVPGRQQSVNSRADRTGSAVFREAVVRTPSMLAGVLAGAALGWPLRRSRPVLAGLIALLMGLHPWLVVTSTEARGYALLLLLAVIATNSLPGREDAAAADNARAGSICWRYVAAAVAMLYTVPIGLTVVAGHGVAMAAARRRWLWQWLLSAVVAGIFTLVLYAPFFDDAADYYSTPFTPTVTYREFLDHLPRMAHAGMVIPGPVHWAVPVLLMVAGSVLAWRRRILRVHLLSFAVASVIGILAPLALRSAGEVRFVPWLIVLYAIGVVGAFAWPAGRGWLRWAGGAGLVTMLAWMALRVYVIWHTPAQPIREGLDLAGQLAPRDAQIAAVYMAGAEAVDLYSDRVAQGVHLAYTVDQLRSIESASARPAWAVVVYERLLQRDQPRLWDYLQQNYVLERRLAGRLSPVAVYRPNAEGFQKP